MKQFKLLSFVCCLMLAVVVSSCLSDDDNNQNTGLTNAEKALCYTVVAGDYSGKLMYYNIEQKIDTVDIAWRIPSDSILTVLQFPSAAVAGCVSSEPLKEALLEQPAQPLNCYIGFISASPVEFLINPLPLTYNLHYSDADHQVQLLFYVNNTYSFGTYDATTKRLGLQLLVGALYVDGQQSSYLSRNALFVFQSNPKE